MNPICFDVVFKFLNNVNVIGRKAATKKGEESITE